MSIFSGYLSFSNALPNHAEYAANSQINRRVLDSPREVSVDYEAIRQAIHLVTTRRIKQIYRFDHENQEWRQIK